MDKNVVEKIIFLELRPNIGAPKRTKKGTKVRGKGSVDTVCHLMIFVNAEAEPKIKRNGPI